MCEQLNTPPPNDHMHAPPPQIICMHAPPNDHMHAPPPPMIMIVYAHPSPSMIICMHAPHTPMIVCMHGPPPPRPSSLFPNACPPTPPAPRTHLHIVQLRKQAAGKLIHQRDQRLGYLHACSTPHGLGVKDGGVGWLDTCTHTGNMAWTPARIRVTWPGHLHAYGNMAWTPARIR